MIDAGASAASGRPDAFRVCVFCGSRAGADPAFATIAEAAGRGIAEAGARLVYGGGDVGLMGRCARAAMAAGGRVTGYIPERLQQREVALRDLPDLRVTATMFERKAAMVEDADAFLVLPGGLGTLDELLDAVTLKQLGYHDLPIVLVDHAGFWRPWPAFVAHLERHGFVDAGVSALFRLVPDVTEALRALNLAPRDDSPDRP